MSRWFLKVCWVIVLASRASSAAADELLDRLQAIPGLTIVQEKPATGGRFFLLTFEQPINHLQPWKGTFTQRINLFHVSEDRPTVFYSGGYGIGTNFSRTELTRLVEGNQITIEHRFFGPSTPVPTDWNDLTIFQQASDDHHVVVAFKAALYPGRWLRTGASKGGMQATYHTRFYPRDVDGLVAYVAPNDAIDSHDAYARFLDNVGTDPQCRENLKAIQHEALLRRDEIVPLMEEFTGGTYDHVFGSADKAFELAVVEMPFTFWQIFDQSFCALIPPTDAPSIDIFFFLDTVQILFFFTDEGVANFIPYYVQAGTQLGYPTLDDRHLTDVLRYPGADVPRSFVPAEIPFFPFQWWAMPDINLNVRLLGRHQMFIYGENDPWGAERFHPNTRNDSFLYVVADGNHSANVTQLAPADQQAAIAAIRRWAGLPPLTLTELGAMRARQPAEPDLDQIDRFARWRR